MKKSLLYSALTLAMLLYNGLAALACEVCEKNQPTGMAKVTHGAGPQGNIDYIITWSAVVIVVVALFLSIKYLVKPKENDPNHIKYSIVD